jgi:endonuclease YncB( thermonuclease family)
MVRVALVSLLVWIVAPGPVAAAERLPGPYRAQVIRVIDGDSIEAQVTIWLGQQVTTTVRMAGIDTAELDAPCLSARLNAVAARAYLKARVDGRTVSLTEVETDKYGGRIVAQLIDETGENLGVSLTVRGLARPYRGRRPDWCGGGR